MSQAKKDFEARMAHQEEARTQRQAIKQQQSEADLSDPTKTATFLQSFTSLQKELDDKVQEVKKSQVEEELEGCVGALQSMITLLHNYASFLPAYETRHAQQVCLPFSALFPLLPVLLLFYYYQFF